MCIEGLLLTPYFFLELYVYEKTCLNRYDPYFIKTRFQPHIQSGIIRTRNNLKDVNIYAVRLKIVTC